MAAQSRSKKQYTRPTERLEDVPSAYKPKKKKAPKPKTRGVKYA